uniref:DDE-1 domain-containing protein n=1 Tax=Spongospora subterranea TaxID=70186 RepID=A0A0H5RIL9_9EUKA|eukprot:CRZ08539.1 hypothetical protein [Spongospora subterranea]
MAYLSCCNQTTGRHWECGETSRLIPYQVPHIVRVQKPGMINSLDLFLSRFCKPQMTLVQVFPLYMKESRAYPLDPRREEIHLWVDNCGGHNASQELDAALAETNTTIHYFPPCATDLVQPADSLVISKIKDEWTRRWDLKKFELIQREEWSNNVRTDGNWSDKLKNPGKAYFLQLAADCVRAVNSMRDSNGLTYARQAMIQCGLSLDVTGFWLVKQLTPELQNIIAKHTNHFDGEPLPDLAPAAIYLAVVLLCKSLFNTTKICSR